MKKRLKKRLKKDSHKTSRPNSNLKDLATFMCLAPIVQPWNHGPRKMFVFSDPGGQEIQIGADTVSTENNFVQAQSPPVDYLPRPAYYYSTNYQRWTPD